MIKEYLNRLELKFNKVMKFSKESFISATLKDSETVVEYSSEVGGEANVSSGSGSEPLGDGEHELSNGVKITVKDGKVESIEQPEAIEEKPEELSTEEDDKAEEKSDDEDKVEEVIEEAKSEESEEEKEDEDKVEISLENKEDEPAEEAKSEDELKAEIAELKAEIEKLKEGFSSLPNTEALEAFKTSIIADLTATLRNTPAQSFTAVVEEKEEDRFLAMARASKRNKN